MFLDIRHRTTYSYQHAVILEPHMIRLTPRADSYRRLIERTLTIIPEPDGVNESLDYNGALSHYVWFQRQTPQLTVLSHVVLELNERNPFDFIVHPASCLNLPMQYPEHMSSQLKPFLLSQPVHEKVNAFALNVLNESNHNVIEFVTLLARKVRQECIYENRKSGEPYAPEKVLAMRQGSCRDLTVLYIAAAQAVGLAARFVSGYYFDQSPKNPDLHAWAEVYIPGGGWKGFDPTIGLACYGHHIALAAAASSTQTAAIEGAFLGQPESQMDVQIEYQYLKQIPRPVEF